MAYVPFTYGEGPVSSSKLNGNFASKADLDPITGKVRADQAPVADTSAATAAAAAALAEALAAHAAATAAGTAAGAANTAAVAAQATAKAAIPLTAEGVTVATLGADGLLTTAQRPPATGGGPAYTVPLLASFPVWINKNSANASDTAKALEMHPESTPASYGNVLSGVFRDLPVGDFDLEVVIEKCGVLWPFFSCGISLLESSTGRYHSLHYGSVYYVDPWNASFNRDVCGLNQMFWSNSLTVSDAIGIPFPVTRLHQRIIRTGTTIQRQFRRTVDGAWVNLWGLVVPAGFTPDKIGISYHATVMGNLANFPPQTFQVMHYGAPL